MKSASISLSLLLDMCRCHSSFKDQYIGDPMLSYIGLGTTKKQKTKKPKRIVIFALHILKYLVSCTNIHVRVLSSSWQACYWMRLQPSEMLTAQASSVWYGSWIHKIFGHVVSISQAYLRLLRAGYAALIDAILSFSRGFWLTLFGFLYSSMVLDSCVKVRCLVLCIDKCLGRRCRSVIDIACVFLTCFTFARRRKLLVSV